MAKERLPFELAKPSNDTFVTETSEIGHNGEPLDEVLEGLDNISKESTQSEEEAIIYETDGGVQVGRIDSTGADFINLKKNGANVATEDQIPTLPTIDNTIGNNPTNTNVPSTKAVKTYVDSNIPNYPIDKETTESANEEVIFGNDEGTQKYVKVSFEGISAVAYKDMQGNNVIPVKDTSIGENPSKTNVPTSKAVADYVETHGGGTGDLPIEKTVTPSLEEYVVIRNSADTEDVFKVTDEGARVKSLKDMQGNPIGGINVSVQTISGKNYLVFG